MVERVVEDAGCDLEELIVTRVGRRFVVRVMVDRDGGINLDAVADVSRALSAALDRAEESGGELFAGEYQLEVGSPGVDRPLLQPRHWRRNVGRLVRVTVDDHPVTGRVLAADADGVVLDVAGQTREVPYGELGPGRVQVELNRLDSVVDHELDEIEDPDADHVCDGEDSFDGEELEDEER